MSDKKSKYWTAVLYTENMIEGWEKDICKLLQIPFAYCVHNMDGGKEHVHIVIAFSNTTTYTHAFSTLTALNACGLQAFNKIESVKGIKYIYEYLIHNTDDSRDKYQYPKFVTNMWEWVQYHAICETRKRGYDRNIQRDM